MNRFVLSKQLLNSYCHVGRQRMCVSTTPSSSSLTRKNTAVGFTVAGFVGCVYFYTMYKMRLGVENDLDILDQIDDTVRPTSDGLVSVARGKVSGGNSGQSSLEPVSDMAKHAHAAAVAEIAKMQKSKPSSKQSSGWFSGWFGS